MKIKNSTLDIIFLCFTFYEVTLLPHMLYIAIKYVVLLYLFYKYFLECSQIKMMTSLVLLYGVVTFFSTAYNKLAVNTITASFVYCIQIVDIFIVANRFVRKKDTETLLKIVFKTFFIYIIATDILMLIINYNFSNPAEEYLIGNKFIVSYLHCFEACILFYLTQKENEKEKKRTCFFQRELWPFMFMTYSVLICYRVTCSTGMVICILLGVLMLIPNKLKSILSDGKPIILSALIFNILILGSYGLFTNPFVASFISNVMGKSTTWIGRMKIYEVVMDIIFKSPVIGYGYFNNAVSNAVSFNGNAQNGILKILVDSGVVGLIGYAGSIYIGLQNDKEHNDRQLWPLYAFIYTMIAASLVEINLTHMIVFLTVAVIYAQHNSCRSQKKKGKG